MNDDHPADERMEPYLDVLADYRRTIAAKAWDEGYEAGALAARGEDSVNPYRPPKAEEDA